MSRVEIATPAPDFSLMDYTGKLISLSDFKGKSHVLLVFNRTFT